MFAPGTPGPLGRFELLLVLFLPLDEPLVVVEPVVVCVRDEPCWLWAG
ncbi:MAG TPA: hypothetical protein VGH56_06175 [Solirubrobacteraceae bacterium]